MKAFEWIDRVRTAKGWTDYRVAKELGFTQSTISMYRIHGGPMDEAIAIKVANALGERPEAVVLDQLAERTKDPTIRTSIRNVAASLCILCKQATASVFVADRRRVPRIAL